MMMIRQIMIDTGGVIDMVNLVDQAVFFESRDRPIYGIQRNRFQAFADLMENTLGRRVIGVLN